MKFKFTCQTADYFYHDYEGTLRGAKNAASKYYDAHAVIEIWDVVVYEDTGTEVVSDQVAVKRDGKWTDCQ